MDAAPTTRRLGLPPTLKPIVARHRADGLHGVDGSSEAREHAAFMTRHITSPSVISRQQRLSGSVTTPPCHERP